MIGHELTALHGIDHARTLAIVMPALLDAQLATKAAKLVRFAEHVWGVTAGTAEEKVDAAIACTRAFYESIGIKTRLADYEVSAAVAPKVAARLAARGMTALGERGDLTPARI